MNQCSICILDDLDDKDISFNEDNICNYCVEFNSRVKNYTFTKEQEAKNLEKIKTQLTKNNNEYDVIIGLSGGVDSSYVCYLAHKMGLKCLLIQMDNGWNSKISTSNINKIVKKTGYDYYNYLLNWNEFKDLQKSFIKAGVIDLEVLTDHAVWAVLFKYTKKFKIKYTLTGDNYLTENGMPSSWNWIKSDSTNIKDIHNKYGTVKLKTFPFLSFYRWYLNSYFGFESTMIPILNKINYNKFDAIKKLKDYFNWEEYEGKHYESNFTKFYQAYILPKKFKVDKRKSHLSAIIRSGQISKSDAINELNKPLFTGNQLQLEKEYFEKKLDYSTKEFDQIMDEKPVSHDYFKSDKPKFKILWNISYIISRFQNIKKTFSN